MSTVKTNCHFCGYLCGFEAEVEDGRIVSLAPDPSRYPYDEQVLQGCPRWRMNLDVLDGVDRVNFPLKRAGERGSGQWERISWDQALDEIASRLEELREEHNPGVLASMIGGPHTSFWPLHRFMSLFGSPNNAGIGQICWNPRIWSDTIAFGWTIEPDITEETRCLIVWGTNPAESDNSLFWRSLLRMHKAGSPKIVVIDPRLTKTARIADEWIALKPGTDCTFALGLLHVIIEEGLYDHGFVERWCTGFDELAAHVEPYTPEVVARTCGLAADDVVRVARLFAQSPSAIITGRGIDQIGENVLPTHRARTALLAICGDVDRPGGCTLLETSEFTSELKLECTLENFDQLKALSLNRGRTPLQSYESYERVKTLMDAAGRELPARYLTSVHPDLLLKAMEGAGPYPVRALIVEATNPLLTYADTHRVLDALRGLDLLVVLDYYLTPTAALADYALPAAGAMERATFQAHGGVANFVYGGDAAVEPYYERKADYDVFAELGRRLGQEAHWSDDTFAEACERALAPTGLDWEGYCQVGMYATPTPHFKHEQLTEAGEPRGFATPSGKVELASSFLEQLGAGRLPEPGEPYRLCSPEMVEAHEAEGWEHLTLITGGRRQPYNASMYLNHPPFRKRQPYPLAQVSEATAKRLGAQAGDVIQLATDKGQACFVLEIIPMVDGVIHADYGWWHPESEVRAPDFGGIFESNVNVLTSCSLDQAEPLIGTWAYNDMDCMARVAGSPLTWTADVDKQALSARSADGLTKEER